MTDPTPMRERLARALWFVDAAPHGMRLEQWANVEAQDYYLVRVDAILDVLETPTKAVVKAGNSPRGYTMDGYQQPHTSTDVWAAMVKAIRGGA